MARVKGALATRKRRKRVLKLAKGYFGSKSKLYRIANQAVMKSGVYAYRDRNFKRINRFACTRWKMGWRNPFRRKQAPALGARRFCSRFLRNERLGRIRLQNN
mgnify:CR=1 FL=1